ncbi:hypothetical protein [Clostridium culturomicium]|uniref:hypothetical protein n=1 Tax=Clostridium culturomicium TaxID=1499683 RepID=UPI00058B090D|nr:hypothetical protein [Clostridium culturomicium]
MNILKRENKLERQCSKFNIIKRIQIKKKLQEEAINKALSKYVRENIDVTKLVLTRATLNDLLVNNKTNDEGADEDEQINETSLYYKRN